MSAGAGGPVERLRPVPPRTTVVRNWHDIPGDDVPTDREYLTWLEGRAHDGDADAAAKAAELRARAGRGFHDGSLPELGEFRPVFYVPAVELDQGDDGEPVR